MDRGAVVVFACFLIGVVLGAVSGMPVGALGATIIDTAGRAPLRRAVYVGIGGGCGDMLWATLCAVGIGPLLASSPAARPALFAASGVALIVYGSFKMRGQRARARAGGSAPVAIREKGQGRAGFAVGLGLVIANPASMLTWVALLGIFFAGAAPAEAIAAAVGIGIGSTCWSVFLAHIARRGTKLLGERAAWIPSVTAVLLIGYGLVSLARGAGYWIGPI